MTATTRCTCSTHPGEYCPMHGCPHPASDRGCNCPANLGEAHRQVDTTFDNGPQRYVDDGPVPTGSVRRMFGELAEANPQIDLIKDDEARCSKCGKAFGPFDITVQDTTQKAAHVNCNDPEMDSKVDMVNHPPHYTSHPSGIECIEITRHLSFDVGNAFKYVFRTDLKNGRQDIEKARFYLRDALDHGTACFLPSWNFEIDQKLDRVLGAESIPHRLLFFLAIGRGNLQTALGAVEMMLDTA